MLAKALNPASETSLSMNSLTDILPRVHRRRTSLACAAALSLGLFTPSLVAKSSSSNLELARQLNQAFVEIAEKVSPTVVVINVIQALPQNIKDDEDNGDYESLPPGFWRQFHQQFHRPDKVPGQGSGVIIRENGYILTNTHVVEDAESITVRLKDGRTFKAKVTGIDPQSDVAVIKIDAQGLPVATLADSSRTRVGEFAVAIGAPYSLDYTVTFGHVSAKSRSDVVEGAEAASMDQDFLQTDALINPGNSGGPLVNIEGEVIGINTLIRGLHTGIGFAIPSNFAKEVAEQLIAQGKFTRAWLGIGIRALRDDADLRELVPGVNDGVIISAVLSEGPAAKSDLRPGDVITAVDGKRVSTPQQLRSEVRGKRIGQPITLDLIRKGTAIQVKVSPGEWKQPVPVMAKAKTESAPKDSPASLGVTVEPLTPELVSRLNLDPAEGVVVAKVEKNSPAAKKGIKPGDLITAIDQQPVAAPKEYEQAVSKADLKKGVLVNLQSGSTARFEILKSE